VDSKVAVMLLLSTNEVFKPSNTGRLILDTIQQGFAYQWSRTEPKSEILELLSNTKYQPILVFPKQYVEDESRVITQPDLIQYRNKVPLLIFIDGSWREARKIFSKSAYLSKLPVLSIEPTRLSQYMMRHSENDQHLATAEVASIVLDQLGETHASSVLSSWFDVFRESYMLSKSRFYSDLSRPTLQQYLVAHKDCLNCEDVTDL
jgi:DTW domain-containing protein YfiP